MPAGRRPFAGREGWQRVSPPGEPGPEAPPAEGPPGLTEEDVAELAELLREANQLLTDIRTELREQEPEGIVITITANLAGLAIQDIPFQPPLFTLSITNDGPQAIQYRIPNLGQSVWVVLNPTEVIVFNFPKGKIRSIGLRVLVAAPATNVRLVGTY